MQQIVLCPKEMKVLTSAVESLTERFEETCEVFPGSLAEVRKCLRVAGRVPSRMYIGSPAQYHATMRVLDAAEIVLGDEDQHIEALSDRLFCEVQNDPTIEY